ncbi:MAG: exodeoxyribonuclease VII small subunit [Gammaproteobacteria bacterium]|nr:exodeoxyribonuclease VII small subunit [Gammaproteobacteria bacterium]
MSRTRTTAPDFETALAELEQIVARLERGELSLEESLRQFERGVALTRNCQRALRQAEQKVTALSRGPDGGAIEQEFVPSGDES